MLTLDVPAIELFDDAKQEFIYSEAVTIELEHSLIALSKWESTWEKPFLSPDEKTTEETLDYIKAMTLTPNIPPETYLNLSGDNYKQVNTYIDAKMSATWFNDRKGRGPVKREIITAEIIYYWMVGLNIPMECQYWHLNRLFTFIRVCDEKNNPDKNKNKMSRRDMVAERNALNAKRKAEAQSKG